jgi:hypothetical protein
MASTKFGGALLLGASFVWTGERLWSWITMRSKSGGQHRSSPDAIECVVLESLFVGLRELPFLQIAQYVRNAVCQAAAAGLGNLFLSNRISRDQIRRRHGIDASLHREAVPIVKVMLTPKSL